MEPAGQARVERRLAAILAADVAGYSRLIEVDELVEFASLVDALRCAAEMQAALAESNVPLPPDQRIAFRIGVHQGDIVVEDGDNFGDGVNVAARLEGLAEPGGICVSARVQEDAAGRLDLAFEDIGEQALKNISRLVRAYRVRSDPPSPTLPRNPRIKSGEGREARAVRGWGLWSRRRCRSPTSRQLRCCRSPR
jgi:class 3 adenylate cyclase